MRLLLDSHTLLWAVDAPQRLPSQVSSLIQDAQNTVLVSAASAWELAIKHATGKLPNAKTLLDDYFTVLATYRFTHLDITPQHALTAPQLGSAHKDPFDRLLAAQALVEGATLLSSDAAMQSFGGVSVVWS